jgi:class 3 adenylate cyclase
MPSVRRLTAILAADVAGYSRLMGVDEEGTHDRLQAHLRESENAAHPVEHLLDRRSGPGATRWISALPDTVEHIVVEFDQPQAIGRLVYEVEEAMRERTQEVRVEVSEDGGRTYHQILVQESVGTGTVRVPVS